MSDWGVGMPAARYLDEFGGMVEYVFGSPPYLVGSALQTKQWRDVDVRLILRDEDYAAWGFGHPHGPSAKKASLELAYSALAKHMTGLPVDFQIQQATDANARFSGRRSALLSIAHFREHE